MPLPFQLCGTVCHSASKTHAVNADLEAVSLQIGTPVRLARWENSKREEKKNSWEELSFRADVHLFLLPHPVSAAPCIAAILLSAVVCCARPDPTPTRSKCKMGEGEGERERQSRSVIVALHRLVAKLLLVPHPL